MYPANRGIREFDHGVGIDLALLSVRPSCLGQLSERADKCLPGQPGRGRNCITSLFSSSHWIEVLISSAWDGRVPPPTRPTPKTAASLPRSSRPSFLRIRIRICKI